MATDVSQDKDFQVAPRDEQLAYLTHLDPEFAKASPEDQEMYRRKVTSGGSQTPRPDNLGAAPPKPTNQRTGLYKTMQEATPESRPHSTGELAGDMAIGTGVGAAGLVGAGLAPSAMAAIPEGTIPAAGKKALQVGKTIAYMKGGQMIGKALGLPYGDLAGLIFSGSGKSEPAAPAEAEGVAKAPPEDGVQVVPEPRKPFPGEQPGIMQSVPREELPEQAATGKPGAGTQLQNIGKKIIYQPRGVIGRK